MIPVTGRDEFSDHTGGIVRMMGGGETEKPSDEALVVSYARSSDRRALEVLVERWWPEAYRLAVHLLNDPAVAEDAAQEAFIALVRAAGTFEPDRSFGPWFRTLVMNAARKHSRSRRRRRRHEETFASKRPATFSRNDGEQKLLAAEVTEHLQELPFDLRFPLVLHYYEGRSHDEVAAVMGCPRTTVTTRIRRGLDQLRESLAGVGCAVSTAELENWFGSTRARLPELPIPRRPSVAVLEAGANRAALSALSLKAVAAIVAVSAVALGLRAATQVPKGALSQSAAVATPSESERAPVARRAEEAPRAQIPASSAGVPEKPQSETAAKTEPGTPPTRAPGPAPKPKSLAAGKGTIVGLVLAPDGPVRNAKVRAMIVATVGQSTTAGQTTLRTDDGGWFILDDVPPGQYGIELVSGSLRCARRTLTVEAGQVAEDRFGLEAGAVLVGRVLSADGKATDDTVVVLTRDGDQVAAPIRVGKDGQFRFEGLVPGTYTVRADRRQGVVGARAVVPIDSPKEFSVPDLVLGRGATLMGRVVRRGQSAPAVGVVLEFRLGSDFLGRATSAKDGTFRISGLPAGTVTVGCSDGTSRDIEVPGAGESSMGDLEVERPMGRITGHAFGSGGQALSDVAVALTSLESKIEARSDRNGLFVFEDVSTGRYEMTAQRGELLSSTSPLVQVRDGSSTEVEITLVPSGSVTGVIAAPTARLSKLTVSASTVETTAIPHAPIEAPVGEDGRYRLSGLRPGRYAIRVPGTPKRETVEVASGAEQILNFSLTGGTGRILVTVTAEGPNKAQVLGTFMAVAYEGTFQLGASSEPLGMAPGADGKAVLENLPAGNVGVAITLPGGQSQLLVYRDSITVTEGAPSTVEIAWPDSAKVGRIEGRVSKGTDVRDGLVGVVAMGTGVLVETGIHADGTFVLENVPTGGYSVLLTGQGVSSTPKLEDALKVTVETGKTAGPIVLTPRAEKPR